MKERERGGEGEVREGEEWKKRIKGEKERRERKKK